MNLNVLATVLTMKVVKPALQVVINELVRFFKHKREQQYLNVCICVSTQIQVVTSDIELLQVTKVITSMKQKPNTPALLHVQHVKIAQGKK